MAHSGTIIYMQTVPGHPLLRRLTKPLECKKRDGTVEEIPAGFQWNGSSVPIIFQNIFPRFRHPIASCRHDWRCMNAKNAADRLWADNQFRLDIETTSWKITAWFGYVGVRVGAFLGIGNNF